MRKFGPLTIDSDYINEGESLSSFGPLTAQGNLHVHSIRTFGPAQIRGNLTTNSTKTNGPLIVEGDLSGDFLKVNGPATIKGTAQLNWSKINGPLRVGKAIDVREYLQVNGPFTAHAFKGGSIKIHGPVEVEDSIEALDEIVIRISNTGDTINPIQARVLKAPRVEITSRDEGFFGFVGKIIDLVSSSKRTSFIEIDVAIEADEVILNGVRHVGKITSENIILKNNADCVKD